MFVCQAVKKDFDIKDFIEEQDLETLNILYVEDCEEYSIDMNEDFINESDFNEYNADLTMANINTKQGWYKRVLYNTPAKATAHVFNTVVSSYNERLLANILLFILPPADLQYRSDGGYAIWSDVVAVVVSHPQCQQSFWTGLHVKS